MAGEQRSKSFVRKAISETGFPLEIEISSILDKDWIVYNNDPYVDEDEDKTRDIDIYAVHLTSVYTSEQWKRRDMFFVMKNLVVECKRSLTHAWVLFTRPRPTDWILGLPDGHTSDFLEGLSHGKQSFLDRITQPKIHYDRFPRVAYNYVEVKLKDECDGHGSIFEAQNQLWKCLAYNSKQFHESCEKDRSNRTIMVYFPAIVVDGKLYEATGPTEDLRLLEREHMLLSISRRSKHLGARPRQFLMDVVRKEYFRRYEKLLEQDIKAINDCFKRNRKRFASYADDFVERLS
mgnify:CR=1 FL=1|nr:hypothetical protein [Candidatus Njordarchaeota archaeon]